MSKQLEHLQAEEFRERMGQGGVQLVDVRELDEWEICRIDGARLLPLSGFVESAQKELDAAKPVFLYCHHGVRSAHAGMWLLENGFSEVAHLSGGIEAWSLRVDSSVPRY